MTHNRQNAEHGSSPFDLVSGRPGTDMRFARRAPTRGTSAVSPATSHRPATIEVRVHASTPGQDRPSAADGALACAGVRPPASCRALDRAPGHPDKGMTSAVGDVLEALDLLETDPLVHGDRPAVERSHGEGIALRPERR